MSKYSYSLDVGKDLDDETSVPKGLAKYEQEFKELLEDDQPKAPAADEKQKDVKKEAPKEQKKEPIKEQKKEPVKEVKREVRKEAPKKVEVKKQVAAKPQSKPMPRPVPKPVPVKVKPRESKVERPKAVDARTVSTKLSPQGPAQSAKTTGQIQKPSAPNAQNPSSPASDNLPGGRWPLAILIAVIVIAGLFYAFQSMGVSDVPAATTCTYKYIDSKDGVVLSWENATAVQREWLRQAMLTSESGKAAEIFKMLACPGARVTNESVPMTYADCEVPATYLVVSPVMYDALVKEARRNSMLAGMSNPKSEFKRFFTVAYATEDPKLVTWRVKW